jgi:Putative beta barrel porin-7 (BBP7)
MKFGWLSATAGLLLTTTFAAAQTTRSAVVDNGDYSSLVLPAPAKASVPPPARVFEEPLPSTPSTGAMPVDHGEAFVPPYTIWASGDFLVWKIKSGVVPGLATTVPIGVISTTTTNTFLNPNTGAVTSIQPNPPTVVPLTIQTSASLASGDKLDVGDQFGGRFTVGMWLNPEQSLGIEGSGFFITRRTAGFQSSTGNTTDQTVIPLGTNNTYFLTPATIGGSTSVNIGGGTAGNGAPSLFQSFSVNAVRQATSTVVGSGSTAMWGAELNARCASPSLGAVSGLFGFRYLNLREDLTINDSFQLFQPQGFPDPTNAGLPPSISYATYDLIRTSNQFYGAQIGVDFDMFVGNFTIDFVAKAALGVMHQTATVIGDNLQLNGVVAPGGLLSSAFDQGNHNRDRIAFIPEINLKLGYQILPSMRVYVGYDCLYLSSVVRPGAQTGLSTTTIQANVGGANSQITVNEPSYRYKANDLVVNGINFGMEFRY